MVLTFCTALVALAALAIANPAPRVFKRQGNSTNSTLTSFVTTQQQISLNGALNNIGGFNSSLIPDVTPGMVVASPSTVNPNYFYSWTRDSALTYAMIVDELILGNLSLQTTVEDYTRAQADLQTLTNPSGSLYPAGLGLGDPKFYTNITRYNGMWGRPQRDGPALRAQVFINLCAGLIANNRSSVAKQIYWPLILNDLKYVGQYWNETGYDLWEEVHGSSFFTITVSHRALASGANLARQLGLPCPPCQQAPNVLCFIQNSFWNSTGGYITADVNVNQVNRSGINVDPILGAIHTFDISASCTAPDYQPCSSRMLATHKVVTDSFRNLYPINMNATAPTAVAIGRYPEDTYYTGNPWYLTTLAMAEFLYDAAAQIRNVGQVTIDNTSLPFFMDIFPSAKQAVYTGAALSQILDAMTTYGDGFMSVVQQYTPQNGSLNEQINKTTGEPVSALDLTWSFASFVTASRRRAGSFPPSWGANNVSTISNGTSSNGTSSNGTCPGYSSTNSTGTYMPVLALNAPTVDMSCRTLVEFRCNESTSFGQNVYIVGNTTDMGGAVNNQRTIILPTNPGNITWYNPEWFLDIYLPAGVPVMYQYVLQQSNDTYTFENTTRMVYPSACGGGMVQTNDAPTFPT